MNSDNTDNTANAVVHDTHSARTPFGTRLQELAEHYSRLCVGIDPHPSLLQAWGLDDTVTGLREFSRRCVEAFGDSAALIKPQVALFERFGAQGYVVLEETLEALRQAPALVIADAKRGDIGSTMAGYASAWLSDTSPLRADAVTVSPYLGIGALKPAFDLARETGRGVFVLASTSNPEAVEVQNFVAAKSPETAGLPETAESTTTLAQHVVDYCSDVNASSQAPFVGVVVGATVRNPPQLANLGGPILMPGVGAQGGTVSDIARVARDCEGWALPSVSRSVLSAGPYVSDLRKALNSQGRALV